MSASTLTYVLGYVGAILLVGGSTVATVFVALDPQSLPRRRWASYVKGLDDMCRFLFLDSDGKSIARGQLIAFGLVPVVSFILEEAILLALWPLILFIPYVVLRRRCRERVQHLEDLLDSWLLLLSNALKASPSLGEAVTNSAKLMRAPWSQELDLCLKEMKLGTPLDQAILNMSTRVGSTTVSSALATILVGRQTGGDLPRILEESAATLREMARLEGVVRTKTAEGKTQAYVLGAMPFVLIVAIYLVDENWLTPLSQTTVGYGIIAAAVVLWVLAILLARRVLAVDV